MSVDALRYLISEKGGIARNNLFRVQLPSINSIINKTNPSRLVRTINSEDLNILCTSVDLPFRQIQTIEREIGPKNVKMARSVIEDDVNMSFLVLNDYGIKHYFDVWQDQIINRENYEINYFNEYTHDIDIYQMRQSFAKEWQQYSGKSDFANNMQYTDYGISNSNPFLNKKMDENEVIYHCKLINAFPTSVSAINLSNQKGGIVELQVQFSYRKWTSDLDELNKTLFK